MEDHVYFIADTHFGHDRIIKYENRPFKDSLEMDEYIIKQWNSTVAPEDKVFVLGDFSFYDKEKTSEICRRLHGKKRLIMGNHDTQKPDYYRACGFENVYEYPIIYDNYWILSHEPLYINENMPYANIFGHVHKSKIYTDFSVQSFCVCAERIDYTPILFAFIKEKMGVL